MIPHHHHVRAPHVHMQVHLLAGVRACTREVHAVSCKLVGDFHFQPQRPKISDILKMILELRSSPSSSKCRRFLVFGSWKWKSLLSTGSMTPTLRLSGRRPKSLKVGVMDPVDRPKDLRKPTSGPQRSWGPWGGFLEVFGLASNQTPFTLKRPDRPKAYRVFWGWRGFDCDRKKDLRNPTWGPRRSLRPSRGFLEIFLLVVTLLLRSPRSPLKYEIWIMRVLGIEERDS